MSKRLNPILPIAAWGALGFYRGTQLYNFNYNKDLKYYETKIKSDPRLFSYLEKPTKYYTMQFGIGLLGAGLYINPVTCIFTAIKEIYRLEVNLRNLKEKKEYYEFFFW